MSVKAHYENHLAHFYSWMSGDRETRQQEFTAFLKRNGIYPSTTGRAIDFGAGHGIQSIPLALEGFDVLAVDFNQALLTELNQAKSSLNIETRLDDMRQVMQHKNYQPELILCCGDTVLHLESKNEVRRFLTDCIAILAPSGKLILSFRDYTSELKGDARFIPVKQDENRMLTCFLEYETDKIHVTDLLCEKTSEGWQQKVSSYEKVRMLPEEISEYLLSLEVKILSAETERGMTNLVIQKQIK